MSSILCALCLPQWHFPNGGPSANWKQTVSEEDLQSTTGPILLRKTLFGEKCHIHGVHRSDAPTVCRGLQCLLWQRACGDRAVVVLLQMDSSTYWLTASVRITLTKNFHWFFRANEQLILNLKITTNIIKNQIVNHLKLIIQIFSPTSNTRISKNIKTISTCHFAFLSSFFRVVVGGNVRIREIGLREKHCELAKWYHHRRPGEESAGVLRPVLFSPILSCFSPLTRGVRLFSILGNSLCRVCIPHYHAPLNYLHTTRHHLLTTLTTWLCVSVSLEILCLYWLFSESSSRGCSFHQ